VANTDPAIQVSTETLGQLATEAARAGDVKTLALLLSAGVPVETTSARGDSLLNLAAYHDRIDAVRLLLRFGADPNQRGAMGQTPLVGVTLKGLVEIAGVLVEAGADVNASTADGRTLLGLAAACNRPSMVQWLLDHGALRDHRDAAGARPLDVALTFGASEAARLLEDQ